MNKYTLPNGTLKNKLGILFGQINNMHPFREGNGRTQRIFIEAVAKQAGYEIDFSEITKERMIQASIEFNQGNPKKMQELFVEALDKQMVENLKHANDYFRSEYGVDGWNNLYVAHSHENNTYYGVFVAATATDFMIQLRGNNNGTLEHNAIIISKKEHMQYLDNQNPKSGEKIALNIPTMITKKIHQKENTEQAEIGETYTGKILSVDNDTVTQQRAKNQPIIIHQTKNLPDITPDDIGKRLKIVCGSGGKAAVSEATRGIGKQKENLLNNEKSNQFDNDFEK